MNEKDDEQPKHLRPVGEPSSVRSPDAVIEQAKGESELTQQVREIRTALSREDALRVIHKERADAVGAHAFAKRYLIGSLSHLGLALAHAAGDLPANENDIDIDRLVSEILETHKLVADLDALIESVSR